MQRCPKKILLQHLSMQWDWSDVGNDRSARPEDDSTATRNNATLSLPPREEVPVLLALDPGFFFALALVHSCVLDLEFFFLGWDCGLMGRYLRSGILDTTN
ncbi:unnamed protein product [Periconia digitata]|uniref:Uncharacterized protein n=1 Tax=Periconia digitata TaxID=1303443 RepID=A0A9W4XRH5_9PLEO|nr:unnamed protein product [Periconia digitata]